MLKAPFQPAVFCPELIGRSPYVAAAEHLLAQIESGAATTHSLLISGEGGIGKSRLVAAIKHRAMASGTG